MLVNFHSEYFLIFAIITLIIFWLAPNKLRNYVLIIASITYYCSWDYRFIALVIGTIILDYTYALKIHSADSESTRKRLLYQCVSIHLLILAIFKYFNFFVGSFSDLANFFHLNIPQYQLEIVAPLGISFFTFQSLSYTVDVYRGRSEIEKSFATYSLYVMFFPQMIAGPIEKSHNFLPQLKKTKELRAIDFQEGFFLFFYGFLKKTIIADNLYVLVSKLESESSKGAVVLLAIGFLFMIQVYCDFSGYSYMARGIARFFNIKLSTNFNFPLFAKNPSDFWNRWHITLSTWVKTYFFTPLTIYFRNPYLALCICFPIMGLWHGANWWFVLWGVYWLVLTLIHELYLSHVKSTLRLPSYLTYPLMLFSSCVSFILFKVAMKKGLFQDFQFSMTTDLDVILTLVKQHQALFILVIIFILFEYFLSRRKDLFFILQYSKYLQISFYITLYFVYRYYSGGANLDYIYFNF